MLKKLPIPALEMQSVTSALKIKVIKWNLYSSASTPTTSLNTITQNHVLSETKNMVWLIRLENQGSLMSPFSFNIPPYLYAAAFL